MTNTDELPLATVIIPAKNAMATLNYQLNALKNQVFVDMNRIEIIISDNGENPGLDDLISNYNAEGLPLLRKIDANAYRGGTAYARNMGAFYAKSNNLLFCDADDEVMITWMFEGRSALSRVPAFSGGAIPVERGKPLSNEEYRAYLWVESNDIPQGQYPILLGCSFGIKRDFLFQIGSFSNALGAYGEDNDLGFRIQRKLGYLPKSPQVCVRYTQTNGSLRGNYMAGRNLMKVLRKYDATSYAPSMQGHWIARPLKESIKNRDPRPAIRLAGMLSSYKRSQLSSLRESESI